MDTRYVLVPVWLILSCVVLVFFMVGTWDRLSDLQAGVIFALLMILLFGMPFVFFVFLQEKTERKRAQQWQAFAESLGWAYLAKDDRSVKAQLDRFRLASAGEGVSSDSPEIANVLRGKHGGYRIVCFEYTYWVWASIGGRPVKVPHFHSVLLLSSPDLELPDFVLKRRTLRDKIGEFAGMRQRVLLGDAAFNERFVLQGSNERRISELFTSDVMNRLLTLGKCYVEGADDTLLFSYTHKGFSSKDRLRTRDDIESFLQEACELAKVLEQAATHPETARRRETREPWDAKAPSDSGAVPAAILTSFTCPFCGLRTSVGREHVGKSGPCRGCGRMITVPPSQAPRFPEKRRLPPAGYEETTQAAGEAPTARLYTQVHVGIAALLGGPLAAFYLMSVNFKRLGDKARAKQALAIGIAVLLMAGAALVLLTLWVGRSPPGLPIWVFYLAVVVLYFRYYQAKRIESHLARGGPKCSGWKAAGIGVLSALLSTCLIVLMGLSVGAWEAMEKEVAEGRPEAGGPDAEEKPAAKSGRRRAAPATERDQLLGDLESGDHWRVLEALREKLPEKADPELAAALLKLVDHDSVFVRHSAMEGLARLKVEEAAEPIARKLGSLEDRMAASEALQRIGPAAESAVLEQLEHADWGVRRQACEILGNIGAEKSVAALNKALADSGPFVRDFAREALQKIQARTQRKPELAEQEQRKKAEPTGEPLPAEGAPAEGRTAKPAADAAPGGSGDLLQRAQQLAEQVNAFPSGHMQEQSDLMEAFLGELTRIWPAEADQPSATSISPPGERPTTGPNSADWFGYLGAGYWRVFEVPAGKPLLLSARGDGQVISTIRFTISERSDGDWAVKQKVDGPIRFSGYRWYFYTPETSRIRVDTQDMGSMFYLRVYQL